MSKNEQPVFHVGSKSATAVAVNTAAKAGEWIKSKLGAYRNLSTKSSMNDLVTEVDKGAETMIRNLIATHFPEHEILGEEGVAPGAESAVQAVAAKRDAEWLWIIDPLDGTTNFVHGFPFFSVSIALAHRGELIVGVVYDPMMDELFVGEKGKGAYVKGKKTAVSGTERLAQGLIATGLSPDPVRTMPANLRGLQAMAGRAQNVRMGGSAALHLAYVAAGRLDGFWEIGLNAWDIAAGALILQESGGRITDTRGEPFNLAVRNVLGSNGRIHDELRTVLEGADALG